MDDGLWCCSLVRLFFVFCSLIQLYLSLSAYIYIATNEEREREIGLSLTMKVLCVPYSLSIYTYTLLMVIEFNSGYEITQNTHTHTPMLLRRLLPFPAKSTRLHIWCSHATVSHRAYSRALTDEEGGKEKKRSDNDVNDDTDDVHRRRMRREQLQSLLHENADRVEMASLSSQLAEDDSHDGSERKKRIEWRQQLRDEEEEKLERLKTKHIAEERMYQLMQMHRRVLSANDEKRFLYAARVFAKPRLGLRYGGGSGSGGDGDGDGVNTEVEMQRSGDDVIKSILKKVPSALIPSDFQEALEIQKIMIRDHLIDGAELRGWKLGVTNLTAQRENDLPHPFVGAVFHVWHNEDRIDWETVLNPFMPAVECEIGFEFNKSLPSVSEEQLQSVSESGFMYSREEIVDALRGIRPVIEIVGPRMTDANFKRHGHKLLMADCGGNIGLVVGDKLLPFEGQSTLDTLQNLRVSLSVDGESVARGTVFDVTGDSHVDLLDVVHWAVNYLVTNGVSIEPGHIISSGTMSGKEYLLEPNQEIVADFGSALGTVKFTTFQP